MRRSLSILNPVTVTLAVMLLYLGAVLAQAEGDPMVFVRVGSEYETRLAVDAEGYDGQFVYFIARDLNPQTVKGFLDVPAYRYQRILLPLTGRALSFGSVELLPWALVLIGVVSHVVGTWLVMKLLVGWGVSKWYALIYGLWVGFLLAVRLDLPEPLSYALVAGAILSEEQRASRQETGTNPWGWVLYSLALFAREVSVLFVAAQLMADAYHRKWREVIGLGSVAVIPFGAFQFWLWRTFGAPGIGSGGAMATPFELIPLMGLLRVGTFSLVMLAAFTVLYLPFVYFPAGWGVWVTAKGWLAGKRDVSTMGLMLNGLIMFFLPFSTVREPGGMLRLMGGLVLALILYAGYYKKRKALNYAFLWLVLNVFLVKS